MKTLTATNNNSFATFAASIGANLVERSVNDMGVYLKQFVKGINAKGQESNVPSKPLTKEAFLAAKAKGLLVSLSVQFVTDNGELVWKTLTQQDIEFNGTELTDRATLDAYVAQLMSIARKEFNAFRVNNNLSFDRIKAENLEIIAKDKTKAELQAEKSVELTDSEEIPF